MYIILFKFFVLVQFVLLSLNSPSRGGSVTKFKVINALLIFALGIVVSTSEIFIFHF